jgi:hypothetical protein
LAQQRSNTTCDPSGVQDGLPSISVFVVRRTTPLPSAPIRYSSGKPPSRSETKAIREPSGEKTGARSADPAGWDVSWTPPEPSALIRKMRKGPSGLVRAA